MKRGIVVCLIVIVMLALSITNVFATEVQDISSLLNNNTVNNTYDNIIQGGTTTNNTNVSSNGIVNNVNKNNVTNITNATNNTVNNTNKNIANNTTLPQTGLDSSLTVMILICGVSILYAYTKIRKSDI